MIYPSTIDTGIRERELAQSGLTDLENQHKIGHSSSPEVVAEQIFRAVTARKRKIITGRTGKLAWWVNKLFPGLYDHLMVKKVRPEITLLDQKAGQSIAPMY